NAEGYISPSLGNAKITMPYVSILKADGEKIKAAIEAGQNPTITFNEGQSSQKPLRRHHLQLFVVRRWPRPGTEA
ncbi:hypothetical protein, partial [Deinococcus radiophilus]|uniref:hypothetical protein n=1 Tax=Deinococcus radiophilus TaxID=32062 RepID=UPI00361F34D5